jgi:regulator of protease activity HflC (stomatin/prohibitin superfamily)
LSPFDPSDPNQTETTLNVQREVTAEELFKRYVQKMEQLSPKEFESVVLGVVHGTTRILAAGMPIDSINDSRDAFNSEIVAGVQNLLLQFGLRVRAFFL